MQSNIFAGHCVAIQEGVCDNPVTFVNNQKWLRKLDLSIAMPLAGLAQQNALTRACAILDHGASLPIMSEACDASHDSIAFINMIIRSETSLTALE